MGGREVVRRAVRLICAGWLPHDRGCVGSGPLVERSSVTQPVLIGQAAHSCVAGRSARCRHAAHWPAVGAGSGLQDGQAPAPSGKLAGDRDHADGGALAAGVQPIPALVRAAVAALGPFPDRGGLARLTDLQGPAGSIGLAVCQAASTSSRRAWRLPVLVIDPWARWVPLDCSAGTSPR